MDSADFDASALPTYVFGTRAVSWWGTIGLILIEGFMLALCIAACFYLRTVVPEWPPPPVQKPDLLVPTVMTALLFMLVPLLLAIQRLSREHKTGGVRAAMILLSIAGCILLAVRWFEFYSLNTKWDVNAYGSILWLLLSVHTFHLIFEVVETVAMTAVLLAGHTSGRYMVSTADSCLFWYFIIGAWAVLYPVMYLLPRLT